METIFEGKVYGSVTVDNKGEIIIPSELRKALNIKTYNKLIILTELNTNSICLIPSNDLRKFLRRASKFILKIKKQRFVQN